MQAKNNISSLLQGVKNPSQLYQTLVQNNPQFKAFVEANKNKSIEQIAGEHNIPIELIRSIMLKN